MNTQPLFGGAIQCLVPADWRDVSDIRQVPVRVGVWDYGKPIVAGRIKTTSFCRECGRVGFRKQQQQLDFER